VIQKSDIDLIRKGQDPFGGKGTIGGKSSVSKRHMKKMSKKEDIMDEEGEDGASD